MTGNADAADEIAFPISGEQTTRFAVKWYVVFVLALVYALNIADRYVVSTVMESIRLDLHLTDFGIAVLTGVSLALFYVTLGIPISMWADRSNRRNIIGIALVLWSLMTACCGLAQTFWQMLAARIGVGVGEAGGTPPSTSMLADLFSHRDRPMAMTFYTLGAPVGAWLGAAFAGRLADAFGWRAAFYGLGAPGLILGVVIFLTVREPRRGRMEPTEATATPVKVPLLEALGFIFRQRAAMHLMMAGAVTALWGWGLMWWTPTFLMRAHAMSAGQAGALLGPMHLVAGSLATVLTARIMATRAMADPKRILWLMAIVVGGDHRAFLHRLLHPRSEGHHDLPVDLRPGHVLLHRPLAWTAPERGAAADASDGDSRHPADGQYRQPGDRAPVRGPGQRHVRGRGRLQCGDLARGPAAARSHRFLGRLPLLGGDPGLRPR